jgi:hypothetical protein
LIIIKVDRVKKPYSRHRDNIINKRNRTFNYKSLRELPLCSMDEEEFKFIAKLLLELQGEKQIESQ